jgi:hypothetical protein
MFSDTQLLLGGITVLGGVVSLLWLRYEWANYQTLKRLEACEKDRAELWQDRAQVWQHLAQMGAPAHAGPDLAQMGRAVPMPPVKGPQ